MATTFPTTIDNLTNPNPTDNTATVSHSAQHANANDAIEAIEAKVGIDGSAVNTSHDFKLSSIATGDKAMSLTGAETATNKTFTSPTLTSPTITNKTSTGTDDGVEILENKTIDASSNTISNILPVAMVTPTAASSAPTGWLLCDGSAVSRTTYSTLFSVISTTYGVGNGSTTFNLPDLEGRVIVGRDSAQTEFDTLGETGGAKTHTLTESELASHTHIQNSHNHTQNAHNHSIRKRTNAALSAAIGFAEGQETTDRDFSTGSTTATNNATTATNQNTGGGAAHNNLQPYLVLNYIIKY